MAEPTAVANMDPKAELRLRELKDAAKQEATARATGNQVLWVRPDGFTTPLTQFDSLGVPFQRDSANQDAVNAMKDPQQPGTTGDIVVTTTMAEDLALLERAFRNRWTMRRPRAVAHLLSRKLGHGDDFGPLGQNHIEYFRDLLQAARVSQ